jgi:hypothetical protein
MHVARVRSRHVDKAGQTREYESVLLRRTFRDGGKVRHQTLGNLSHLPAEVVELVERSLRGERFVPAQATVELGRAARTGTSRRCGRRPRRWGCPRCWVRPAGLGTWPWR